MLDSIYGQVMRVRRRGYERRPERQRHLLRPVISVGNLSMGGTGKSPVVAAIAQWLVDAGERPAILSRGYARRDAVDGVVVVSDGGEIRSTLDRSGDEPLMMSRQVPRAIVCVSPDRYLAGVLAERQLNATVHILDDGFQHLELARDLDILVTTVGEIPNGKVIPNGTLREPRDAAARAQVLVVSDATAGAAASEAWTLGISQSCGVLRRLGDPVAVNGVNEPEGSFTSVLAVAGIAHPDRFFASLKDGGYNIADTMSFGDHHRFSQGDLAAIGARVSQSGATAVFTTDKDAVRFAALGEIPFALYRVPLRLEFDPADALFESVTAALRSSFARSRGPGRDE